MKPAGLYSRACAVFVSVLRVPENERAAAIDSACGLDSELRMEVLRLVSADQEASAGNFLSFGALSDAANLLGYEAPKAGALIGRFRVLEPIGSGGMGLIVKAQDERLHRTVALKLLPAASTLRQDSLLRLQREARAASLLSHPNIVSVFDADFEHVCPHIAMEFVEGRTLRQLLAEGPLNERTILDILTQVASALAGAHSAGIVHRDIKPENIMVREDGLVKVLDFGLAKMRRTLTESVSGSQFDTGAGTVVGTVQYLSPEQILNEEVDARSDLFSLGVVAYELATGARPFDHPAPGGVLNAILNHAAKPPASLHEGISREFNALIVRLIEKDRELRFSSAGELIARCKQMRETQAAFHRFSKPHVKFKRKPLWFALALMAAAAALVYLPWRGHPLTIGDHLRIDRLTTFGRAFNPAISANGQYVAYLSSQSGENTIHVSQLATGANIQAVAAGPGVISNVAFSPDADYLYFTRIKAPNGANGLFRTPLFGGQPQLVLGGAHRAIAFSHDGRFAAVVDRDEKNLTTDSLSILNLSTGKSSVIERRSGAETFASALAWSPDDRYIAAAIGIGNPVGLAVIERETGAVKSVGPRSFVEVDGLAWFADGQHFLALVDRGNSLVQIILVDYPGGETKQITNGLDSYQGLSLSASGDLLVTSVRRRSFHLWVAPWTGNSTGQPVDLPTGEQGVFEGGGGLAWVGTDRLIDSAPDSQGWNLRLITMTGQVQPVTRGAHYRAELTVCPDARTVVYKSDESKNLNLWKTDLVTGESAPVTHGPSVDASPFCSADSKSVIFVSNRKNTVAIWRAGLDGSAPVMLHTIPSEDYALSWDHKKIASFDRLWWTQPPALGIFDMDKGTLLRKINLLLDGHPSGANLHWAPGDSGILFPWERNGATNIWIQPVNGLPARQLTHFRSGVVRSISFSPDGKKLAFSQGNDDTDVVLLRDFVSRH